MSEIILDGTKDPLDTSWMEDAACLNEDPEMFFLDSEDPAWLRRRKAEAARQVCAQCPVFSECRLFGLLVATQDHWGVYGGTTHRERRALRREMGWR